MRVDDAAQALIGLNCLIINSQLQGRNGSIARAGLSDQSAINSTDIWPAAVPVSSVGRLKSVFCDLAWEQLNGVPASA
jgi:hypothetical protein